MSFVSFYSTLIPLEILTEAYLMKIILLLYTTGYNVGFSNAKISSKNSSFAFSNTLNTIGHFAAFSKKISTLSPVNKNRSPL